MSKLEKLIVYTYHSYNEARIHKNWKTNTLQFSLNSEVNCLKLARLIFKRKYRIKPSLVFLALNPVKREIFAGDFKDRIVHHFLYNKLNYFYNKTLINDCYSCRRNKGTDYGIKRVAKFFRQSSKNFSDKSYVMKLDISGYFMNINRNKLYKLNKELIYKIYKNEQREINTLLYILKKIIFNDPRKNCRLKGRKTDWEGLPKNKSLFFAKANTGLPIGNLTSQLFGNIYLNEFDHFVKEKLKCKYYGRYVDDMIFVSKDKEYLKSLIPKINNYLHNKLELSLHPKKIYIQEINKGVPFLGMIIKPYRIYPGKRIRKNFFKALNNASQDKGSINTINSYLGMIKNYNSFKLRKKYLESKTGRLALKVLKARVNKDYSKIEKEF
ncbi:MAG: RNA-directed DNA polymerase [Patescibacteria group bacterium]|jgi:RNA-directed DNA polymerase|nr:RNA-directed DNA polymerase [Patescibacteria group bacterium]